EALVEGGRAVEHADMVEGGVPARVDSTYVGERALEVLERRPGVAVVGTEAREVDVAQVEHVVRLDVEERMAARVPGRVQHPDAHATQVEHVAVVEGERVRPRREVALLDARQPQSRGAASARGVNWNSSTTTRRKASPAGPA